MSTAKKVFNPKLILIALGIGVIATSLISHNSQASKPAPAATPAAAVTVEAVIEKPVIEWDDFSGRIEAMDYVEIRPRVSGTIDAIHFKEGQVVKKGDLLFTIDPRPFMAEVARAEADRASASAAVELAKLELERTHRLLEEHAAPQRELDERNNTSLNANAKLKSAEAALLTAKLNLEYTAITAPVSGRVSRAEITVGNLVGTGQSPSLLTTIVSVSPVYVNFEIDEQTYARYVANGVSGNTNVDKIPVSIGLSSEENYPHQGFIRAFDNRMDTASGTIRVRAIFDNKEGLLTPGMYAKVRTGGGGEKSELLIDDKAVGTDQNKKFVMVVDAGNKATYRNIVLGPIVDGMRIVRSGLKKDEHIIVDGASTDGTVEIVTPNDVVSPTFQQNPAQAYTIPVPKPELKSSLKQASNPAPLEFAWYVQQHKKYIKTTII